MPLTTGSTLQGSKYVIQTLLNQSDFGITYRATHTMLDQPVILQTFNEVVCQRSDFAQLRQQFMAGVRSLSQRPTVRVLDCFEEGEQPYVVLQFDPEQTPPLLSDWLQISLEPQTAQKSMAQTVAQAPKVAQAAPQSPEVKASEVKASENKTFESKTSEAQAAAPAFTPASTDVAPTAINDVPAVAHVAQSEEIPVVAAPEVHTAATLPVAPAAKVREIELPQIPAEVASNGVQSPSVPVDRPKRKVPVALLITALAGLGLGAGAGFAFRYQPVAQTNSTLRSAPSLFSREQAFPSEGDWPVTEVPNTFSSEPKAEEPVYRTAPAPDYYSNPTQPLYPTTPSYSDSPTSTVAPRIESAPEVKTDRIPGESAIPKRSNSLPPSREPIEQPNVAEPAPVAGESQPIPELQAPIAPAPPIRSADPPVVNSAPSQAPKILPMDEPPIVSQ